MVRKPLTLGKVFLILIIVVSLVLSVVFSLQSVTGYVVSDTVDAAANLSALVAFLIGIFGALLYFVKFR